MVPRTLSGVGGREARLRGLKLHPGCFFCWFVKATQSRTIQTDPGEPVLREISWSAKTNSAS